MRVLLKVIGGKNHGREIGIAVPRFVIGRGETAHLRPASDLVSREHAVIEVIDGSVRFTDLQSRNGSFVNGEKISGSAVLKNGDTVRIGRLQFEMIIDPVQAGSKNPKVNSVVDAASRTASSGKKGSLDDDITDWLMESGDEEDPSVTPRLGGSETVQFKLEDTTPIKKELEIESTGGEEADSDAEQSKSFFGKKKKPEKGKLPPIEQPKHDSSTSAADDVLRRLFNRR